MFVMVNMRVGALRIRKLKQSRFCMSVSAIIGIIMIVAGVGLIGYLVFEMIRDRKRRG